MKIVNIDQRSAEWYEWRSKGIGASDIGAIMGVSPWKNALDIYNDKLGFGDVEICNVSMQRGIKYEPMALIAFENLMQSRFHPICVEANEPVEWIRASLDGYCDGLRAVCEIKVPGSTTHESYRDIRKIPKHYYYQLMWQMMITDAKIGYFVSYRPEDNDLIKHDFKPDQEVYNELAVAATEFWYNFLKGIPPKCDVEDLIRIDDEDAIYNSRALENLLMAKKVRAYEAKKEEEIEKTLRKAILDKSDGGDFICGNLIFQFNEGKKSLDKSLLLKDGIDIQKYEKSGTPFWTVKVKE